MMSPIQKVVRSAIAQMGDMTGLVGDNVSKVTKADGG